MNLPPYFLEETPHDCLQYVLLARRMSNRLSAEKIEKSQALPKKVSELLHSESPFEPHPKVLIQMNSDSDSQMNLPIVMSSAEQKNKSTIKEMEPKKISNLVM